MRSLASVQEIGKIEPIAEADRIELAHVLGWQCVVPKGEYHVGDKVIFFEPDSFLPIKPEYEFLRPSSYKKTDYMGEGFLISSRHLRGQLSQGLLMPCTEELEIGTDVTEKLGVKKFEVPEYATKQGTIIGKLPPSVPHTNEIRVQAMPSLLDELGDSAYYISTKMDGSSHSICFDHNGFHVCGHNYEYKDGSFFEYVKARRLDELINRDIVIQGEFCGPGIQRNRLKLLKPEWYVFTVIEGGKRVGLDRMLEICETYKLTFVPIEELGTGLRHRYRDIKDLLELASGEKEGIVIRPIRPKWSNQLNDWLSMKVLNPDY